MIPSKPRCALLHAFLALASATHAPAIALAQTQTAGGTGQSPTRPAHNDPEFESAVAHESQLMARSPNISVARLDEFGIPEMRMDFHFGKVMPSDEASLLEIADRFSFDAGKDGFSRSKDPSSPAVESWRNVILGSEPSDSLPVATFFDPERDMLVVFRRMRMDLSCSGFTAISYSTSGSTTQSFYWNFYADMTMACVGPNLGSNADPDLYLYYWNGGSYSLLTSSIASSTIDCVAALNTGCYSPLWRVRVYMYRGGSFSVRATGFNAS